MVIKFSKDFFEIIMECIASMSNGAFFGALLTALMMGALCWVVCSYYTRLWNKRFRMKPQHHLLCAVAAILTVIFTVQFRAVGNLKFIVDEIIDAWSEKLVGGSDAEYGNSSFPTGGAKEVVTPF